MGLPVTSAARDIGPRTPRADHVVDLAAALSVTALASLLYVLAVGASIVPAPGISITFFTVAPLSATLAWVVLWSRGRAEHDERLRWFATGLAVAVPAMCLQLISFPLIDPTSGPLTTSGEGSAGLYLMFHLAPALAALAGALMLPGGARVYALVVGLALDLGFALDLVPMPAMLAGSKFTPLLILLEAITAVLVLVVAVVWVRSAGRAAGALHAWVSVYLSLAFYDLLFNAIGAERFTPVWWASLSMRAASFLVLAVGCVMAALTSLQLSESYTEAELRRREEQLGESLAVTRSLLSTSARLSRVISLAAVVREVAAQAVEVTELDDVECRALLQRARSDDGDREPPGIADDLVLTHRASADSGACFWADEVSPPDVAAAAMLPIRAAGELLGHLVLWSPRPHRWSVFEQSVLVGLADQAGQALARARAFEEQALAARTLQSSLLPDELPVLRELRLFDCYLPGVGTDVGGDWYDCVDLGDDQVALVIGDVMGKGMHAAAVMGQVRTAVRAVAAADRSPAAVLTALDRVLNLDDDEIVTMTYLLLDLRSGRVSLGRAGHLPPLMLRPAQHPELVYDGGSPPLGTPDVVRTDSSHRMPRGSALVLFTDGLVEVRDDSIETGLGRITSEIADLAQCNGSAPAAGEWERWIAGVRETAQREDDVAILVAVYE